MAHGENAPLNITPGAIRFNTDSMKLEYFRIGMEGGATSSYAGIGTLAAGEWVQITTDTPNIQTGGTRGLFLQGRPSAPANNSNIIDYVTISSTGDAIDFGDLSKSTLGGTALSSSTRGLSATGYSAPAEDNIIDYVTIASTGDAQDFGDLTTVLVYASACSSSTRGLFTNGMQDISPNVYNSVINAVTIASTGNAFDFGDVTLARRSSNNGISNGTRGVFGGGARPPTDYNIIDYVQIATLGDAADFGDLLDTLGNISSCSNNVRGIYAGGGNPSYVNTIQYITISTLGNAIDFGDLSNATAFFASACASPTRAVFGGGNLNPVRTDIIEYVQIMSTGDAIDFGNLTVGRDGTAACSNGHGGLG